MFGSFNDLVDELFICEHLNDTLRIWFEFQHASKDAARRLDEELSVGRAVVSIWKETFGDEMPISRSGIRVLVINFQRRGPVRTPRVKRIQNDVLSWLEIVCDELACRVITNNS